MWFKKKKKEPSIYLMHSSNLLWLEPQTGTKYYNIQFNMDNSLVRKVYLSLVTLLKDSDIYSDKAIVALFAEYEKHYSVYDRCPLLLMYKLTLAINEYHPNNPRMINLVSNKDFLFSRVIPDDLVYHEIPELFKIPGYIEETISELYSRVFYYLTPDRFNLGEYKRLIQYNWLKNWDILLQDRNRVADFIDECLGIIELFLDDTNAQIVSNIIDRHQEEIKERINNLQKQE